MSTPWPTGTILSRFNPIGDPYDEVIVVGGGNEVVIQPHKEFGESKSITASEVRAQYDIDVPDGADLPRPTYLDAGPTPEQIFAQLSKEDGLEYDPTPPLIHPPTAEQLAKMDEADRVAAERASEELARSTSVVTEVQAQPQVGQASHEAEPVVQPENTEASTEDNVVVTEKPSPARGGRKKKADAESSD